MPKSVSNILKAGIAIKKGAKPVCFIHTGVLFYFRLYVYFIYFPNGRYIDYLPLTYSTIKNKTLKLHYKYSKYYKQHLR